MDDNRNNYTFNIFSKYMNVIFSYNYRNGEIVFKIIYDRYFRTFLYNEIKTTSLSVLKKEKDFYKDKLLSNLNWIKKEKLDQLTIDENTEESQILSIENKSIDYLKKNMIGIRFQAFSFAFTSCVFLSFFIFYPIKRVRNTMRVRVIFYFTLFYIILFNSYLLTSITIYNSMNKKYLDDTYKKQIEKYNLILS